MRDIVLIGNPNVGKTTFYNFLTKSFEHTGNWHGVTVDKKQKKFNFEGKTFNIIDMPGLYSLSSFSFEEQVTINELLNKDSTILNICDANVLRRNLYLTVQLIEMGKTPILFLNFDKEIKNKGTIYDYDKLSKLLNLQIILNNKLVKTNLIDKINQNNKFSGTNMAYFDKLPICEILNILTKKQIEKFSFVKKEFIAIKILENDENIIKELKLSEQQEKKMKLVISRKDYVQYIAELRYNYIDEIITQVTIKSKSLIYGKYKIDNIILNKFFAIPILFILLFLIFFLTFSSLGAYLSDLLKNLIDVIIGVPIIKFLTYINAPIWIIDLFSNGIIAGVGGLFSFIPQIVILFLFLSLLEESGYMSRLAFLFEDVFYKFGLSGKSIFTILMSFGCTTSAVLTSRNIEDKNTKIKTAMISPYMSCSAKIPIYAVIGGAFFGKGNIFVIILLYVIGIIVGLVVANILSKTILKSDTNAFILEFPPYRIPKFKQILLVIYQNCKSFVIKVSTILLSFSIIVWVLQNFSFSFTYLPNDSSGESMLKTIGEAISVIFRPIGLDNWGIVVSLIVGVMAKEMVVGTMAIINGLPSGVNFDKTLGLSLITSGYTINFSPLTALIMMIFSLLYLPCISTIAVLKKEIGFKYTLIACVIQFFIAYFICFVIYQIAVGNIVSKIIISLLVIVGLLIIFITSYKLNKKGCIYDCKNCKKHC